ncbi:Hpt domain-containing protein [Hyunsoonleella pacifica]|uniref:Hpt domain-containing protein n=1 Tax=Hyunsoonleella pacifica TaxID=1080224 RepID=A0A4Q9FPX0_9FLAO|nr:Hpt domain-containing protein [Hyunsoonleella pacifica]TBN17471.1 Hpt domain-containing protein [Hyunsoonleella pacifica]GGD11718.1 histidine kinase [Hyunsoonleella pacifica]
METPNLSYLNQLSGGDESFKDKLIAIIKKEFPEEKEVYIKNFKAKDFQALVQNVHKIKHKISILGLEKSYKIAEDYEENLKENNLSGNEAFNEILKTITDYLETL